MLKSCAECAKLFVIFIQRRNAWSTPGEIGDSFGVDMSDSFFSRKRTVAVLKAAVFLSAFSIAGIAFGATFTARAPENFVRSSGQPVTVTRTFSVLDPTTTFTLVIHNGGLNNEFGRVSSAVVTVNGTDVARPNDFNQQVALIQKPVTLQAINTFTVELRSEPGSGFALEFIGTDNVPPTITASADRPANAAGWYNANVVVRFACFDKTSGVASCPAPIPVSTEGGNQTVRGTARNNSGPTAKALIP